jgi:hypothetical protein
MSRKRATAPRWNQSSHGNYADRIGPSSVFAPPKTLAEPVPSSRSDLFGEQHGRTQTAGHHVSIAGFAVHLVLVILSRRLSHPPLIISAVGRNYLSAISTPFSFILFYEVLTL